MSSSIATCIALTVLCLTPLACGDGAGDAAEKSAVLDKFRGAIPDNDVLRARAPADKKTAKGDLGDPAVLPGAAITQTTVINEVFSSALDHMRGQTAGEPTAQDADVYQWGPFSVGGAQELAFIRRLTDVEDGYRYVLVHSTDAVADDSDTVALWGETWGGAQPGGFLYMDLGAIPELGWGTGRVAGVYWDTPVDNGGTASPVAASFRQFALNPGDTPEDHDYYYGTIEWPDQELAWFEFQGLVDLDGDGATELLAIQLGHTYGSGRGEVAILGAGGGGTAIECWDDQLTTTLWLEDPPADADTSACGPLFDSPLADRIPQSDDAEMKADDYAACYADGGPEAHCNF